MRIATGVVLGMAAGSIAADASRAQEGLGRDGSAARITPIVQVVREVGPTVVNLYTDLEIDGGFFGPQEAGSLGSGVIVHPSGLVVTNAHVITGNTRSARIKDVTVSYRPDWSTPDAGMLKHQARVIGFDRTNDLALLRIQAAGPFPHARLGTSSDLMIGETVVAVGNPLGREGSVTHGIVSATNRSLASPTGARFDDLIQTDAPLNSGNSGGPLFNILGELIGINQAIAGDRQFGRAEGQGLAIPVDRVRDLLATEFNPLDLLHAWLGLDVDTDAGGGVVVRAVERDGPADRAGFEPGDVITRVGTYEVADRTAFNLSICSFDVGQPVPMSVVRGGRRRDLSIRPVQLEEVVRDRLGASLVTSSGYVLFASLDADGPASELGIREGDALIEMSGRPIGSVQEVFERLRRIPAGSSVDVLIYRFSRGRPVRKLEGELRL